MAVGDEDMRHGLTLEGLLERLEMFGQLRARVKHSHVSMSDDVDASPDIGERAGIVRNDTANERGDLLHLAIFKINLFFI